MMARPEDLKALAWNRSLRVIVAVWCVMIGAKIAIRMMMLSTTEARDGGAVAHKSIEDDAQLAAPLAHQHPVSARVRRLARF